MGASRSSLIQSVAAAGARRWFCGAARQVPPTLAKVFTELGSLRPPCDAVQLAELAGAAAVRREEMGPKELALLCYRFEDLRWHSRQLCAALEGLPTMPAIVGELSPPEWLAVLRYFAGADHCPPALCDAVAKWTLEHAATLQLHHIEELTNALTHFGYLDCELAEHVAAVLEPLPPGAEHERLLRIASTFAATGLERPQFYQRVLGRTAGNILAAAREDGGGNADLQRAQLLLLLARAGASNPKLVLALVRRMDPGAAHGMMSPTALAPLVRQLHRAALRQEALLLEARPLAVVVARVAERFAGALPVSHLAPLASGLAFLGIEAPTTYGALWRRGVEEGGGAGWRLAIDERAAGPLRTFAQLAWGACVGRTADDSSNRSCSSGRNIGSGSPPAFGLAALAALLDAAAPGAPGLQRVSQQLRQVALCLLSFCRPTVEVGSCALSGGRAAAGAVGRSIDWEEKVCIAGSSAVSAQHWLDLTERSIFFSRRRRAQTRVLRAWQERLKRYGLTCKVVYTKAGGARADRAVGKIVPDTVLVCAGVDCSASALQGGPDTAIMRAGAERCRSVPDAVGESILATVWAKHPLLLAAAAEDPTSLAGGAAEQGCCLNGYEAIERRMGLPSRLLLVRSDAAADDIRAEADCFAEDVRRRLVPSCGEL